MHSMFLKMSYLGRAGRVCVCVCICLAVAVTGFYVALYHPDAEVKD